MGTPLNSAFTRVWFIEGRARPDHTPEFLNFLKVGSLDKTFGSVNPIFEPSKKKYGKFDQVGSFKDAEERATTSLVGHFASKTRSRILELSQGGCEIDMQMHIGECEDPNIFDDFEKIMIFEGVVFETYSTDDMGALEPGEQGKVDETGEISAEKMYEFLPLSFSGKSPDVVTNRLIDVIICDSQSCGDCDDESDGCQRIMAISIAAGGSPSTPADVVFSLDKGLTYAAHDIDSLPTAEAPNALACVGSYVVVVSNASGSMHIALTSEFDGVADPSFSEITTGFIAGGEPNDIFSLGSKSYIVGDRGHIYTTDSNPQNGVTLIDSSTTVSDLNAVHAISEDFAVAVGNDGVVLSINNDLVSLLATSPIGIGTNWDTVHVKSDTEWFAGTSTGVLYRTLDAGATWTIIVLPGTAPTAITDIQMSSNSVMYVSATVSGKGEIFLSVNGGNSFVRSPRNSSNALPNNDVIDALAVCEEDVDFVAGVGLASNGTDGFIVIGSD